MRRVLGSSISPRAHLQRTGASPLGMTLRLSQANRGLIRSRTPSSRPGSLGERLLHARLASRMRHARRSHPPLLSSPPKTPQQSLHFDLRSDVDPSALIHALRAGAGSLREGRVNAAKQQFAASPQASASDSAMTCLIAWRFVASASDQPPRAAASDFRRRCGTHARSRGVNGGRAYRQRVTPEFEGLDERSPQHARSGEGVVIYKRRLHAADGRSIGPTRGCRTSAPVLCAFLRKCRHPPRCAGRRPEPLVILQPLALEGLSVRILSAAMNALFRRSGNRR